MPVEHKPRGEMVQACQRCGSFAELESNGFRWLCQACWRIDRSRFELPTRSPIELVLRTFLLAGRNWRPLVAAVVVVLLPELLRLVTGRAGTIPLWLGFLYEQVAGSGAEALCLAFIVQRTFGGVGSFESARALAVSRYRAVVLLNVLLNLLSLAGSSFWLISTLVRAFLSFTALLTLSEGMGPFSAIREGLRRLKPLYGAVLVIALAAFAAVLGPFFIVGGIMYKEASAFMTANLHLMLWLAMGVIAVSRCLEMSWQVVLWGATRPAGSHHVE